MSDKTDALGRNILPTNQIIVITLATALVFTMDYYSKDTNNLDTRPIGLFLRICAVYVVYNYVFGRQPLNKPSHSTVTPSNAKKIPTAVNPLPEEIPPLNPTTPYPWHKLKIAIQNNKVQESLKLFDEKQDFSIPDQEGNLPIHYAAQKGPVTLLQRSIHINGMNKVNNNRLTPVHLAVAEGNKETVTLLIELNAPLNKLGFYRKNQVDFTGIIPLHIAILNGNTELTGLLIGKSDLYSKVPNFGNVLHLAIYAHQNKVLKELLTTHYALIQNLLKDQNDQYRTPLMEASFRGNAEAVCLLQRAGDCLERSVNGKRALHWAILGNQENIVDLLWFFGCKLKDIDPPGQGLLDLPTKHTALQSYVINLIALEIALTNNPPKYGIYPYDTLVYNGGGPKGIAFVGTNKQLKIEGILRGVKRVAGTSAGAITATLLAIGCTPEELSEILNKTDLSKFLDHSLSKASPSSVWGWVRKQISSAPNLIKTFQNFQKIFSAAKQVASDPTASFTHLKKLAGLSNGFCEGEEFRKWIEDIIFKKTGIAHCTFGELRNLVITKDPTFKHLHVFVTDLTKRAVLQIDSESGKWDDYIISDAVRASMSIPVVFKPHELHRKDTNGLRVRIPDTFYVDGGLLANFPIDAFDFQKYLPTNIENEQGNLPVSNKRILGLKLVDPEPSQPVQSSNQTTVVLKQIMLMYFDAEGFFLNKNPDNKYRSISIDTKGATLLNFNPTEEKKQELIKSGKESTQNHFKARKAYIDEHYPHLPSLEKILKKYHDKQNDHPGPSTPAPVSSPAPQAQASNTPPQSAPRETPIPSGPTNQRVQSDDEIIAEQIPVSAAVDVPMAASSTNQPVEANNDADEVSSDEDSDYKELEIIRKKLNERTKSWLK